MQLASISIQNASCVLIVVRSLETTHFTWKMDCLIVRMVSGDLVFIISSFIEVKQERQLLLVLFLMFAILKCLTHI